MKAFIFDREGNAISTDSITDIMSFGADKPVRIYTGRGDDDFFDAAQDTVEGVVAAIRQAEIDAAYEDEYRRCEARFDFDHTGAAQ